MRGRTIYFQNRRILIFCGKKRKQPHSDNDVFGYAADEIVLSESVSATARNGENLFAENENGAAFGDAAKTVTTEAVQTPVVSPEEGDGGALGLPSEDDGIVTTPVYDSANTGFLIAHNVDKNGVITTDQPLIERDKPHFSFGDANKEIKTRLSRFDEAEEQGLSFREENIHIKTTIPWFAKNAEDAGFSLREEAEEIITPVAVFTEAKDDLLIVDNAGEIKTSVAVFDKANDTAAVGEDTKPLKTETAVLCEERNAVCFSESVKEKINNSVFSSVKNSAAFENYAKAGVEEPVAIGDFISFSSETPFTLKMYNSTSYLWDGTMEYSTNSTNWSAWDGTLIGGTNRLYLRGSNNTRAKGIVNWMILDGNGISIGGNIETLLDYNTVRLGGHPTLAESGLYRLFQNNPAIVNIRELIIGFDIIPRYGCEAMFNNCPNLETSPIFRSKNLYDLAYYQMLQNCPKLKTISQMPATVAERDRCYAEIYKGCTGIKISETQTGEYVHAWKMPQMTFNQANDMFAGTGGTFTGTPSSNTTYYTSNEIIS